MGLLDVHADGIRQSVDFDLRNPAPEQPAESFHAMAFAGAGIKSPARGAYEFAGGFADLAKMFQAEDASPLETEAQTAERAAGAAARRQALGAEADRLRRRSAEIAPDPITSHRANQVISDIGKNVTKAAASIGLLGPVGGSLAFGGEEANQTYHDAIDSGLDHETALKLAGTTGVISGLTAGLPAGGAGIKSTLAIAAGAGPASYIANEAISRKILQNAGHPDEAALHDPTDPLGLALSIALPGVAAGFHMRALGKAKPVDVVRSLETGGLKNPDAAVSPKGAEGSMQVMPATQTDPGFGVTPARDHSPEELARVGRDYFGAMQARYPDDIAKAFAAYNAGPGTLDAAIKAHGADWLAHMPAETQAYVAKAAKKLGDQAVGNPDPATVDAARVSIADEALNARLPDHPDAVAELGRASDAVSAGRVDIAADVERTRMETELRDIETQLANEADPHGALAERRAELTDQLQSRPLVSARPAREPAPEISPQPAQPAEVDPHMFVERQPGTAEPKLEPAKEGEKPQPESLEVQRAQAHMAENPDLHVRLAESGETMRASDALGAARREAAHEAGHKELIRAAVQCALSFVS
jgi:hypothetical protein